MSFDVDRLLNGGQMQAQVPVLAEHVLQRAHFAFERQEDGGMVIYFDLIFGTAGAIRYRIPFGAEGWQEFMRQAQGAGASIEIPRIEPPK